MDITSVKDFFNHLKNDEMSLLYSGDFTDEVTSKVIGLTGAQFEDGSEMNKLQRKTGFLIAECFQNIVRHNESSVENGYFLTRNDNGALYIASGNIILNEMTEGLAGKLNHLNSLSKDELKDVYVQTLSNNTLSAKGGAGLGLIEMARKTGNKLDFRFTPINDVLSYFYFQIKFLTAKNQDNRVDKNHSIDMSIDLRKKMLKNHNFIIYQGDVSMETIMPIMGMVEKSLASKAEELAKQKKVYLVLTEFLQNMSKHGASVNGAQSGLMLVGEKDGQYLIGGVNYVNPEDRLLLEEKLDKYSIMSLDALNNEYKRVLKEGDPANKKGSSLGIIEIARRSSDRIQYEFQSADEQTSLVFMLLKI